MDTSTLMLDSGGWKATLEEIGMVPIPERKNPPIPHLDFLDECSRAFKRIGMPLEFGDGQFALAAKGNEMFGLVPAYNYQEEEDWTPMVGFRASYNKRFAPALAIGSRVFICDNLAMLGDINVTMKNTKNVLTELPLRIAEGVSTFNRWTAGVSAEIKQMKAFHPSDWERDHLICQSVRNNIIPMRHAGRVMRETVDPTHAVFRDGTAWALFNAFTQVAKLRRPRDQMKQGAPLVNLFRNHFLTENRQGMTQTQRDILSEMETEYENVVSVA